MESKLATILIIAFFLIGGIGGFVIKPAQVETVKEIEYQNVTVEVPTEVEVEVASADPYLALAVEDFLDYMDDEDELECDGDGYDIDEVAVSKTYDDWSVAFDDDEYTVNFKIKLKYDEDDEKSCREIYEVEAYYEDDEDVEIEFD